WTDVGMNTTYRFTGVNMSAHLLEIKGVSNSSQVVVVSMTFNIDLYPPSMPAVVQPPLYTNGGRVAVTWGASTDNVSGVAGYQVRVIRTYFNGSAYVNDTGPWTDVGIAYSYTTIGNLDGWYNVSVRARDRGGNIGPEGTVQLILDSVPPRALSYEPLGTSVSVDAILVIRFSEPMVQSSVGVYLGYPGNITWEGDTVVYFTPRYAFPYNATYRVTASGRDLAGNQMTSLLWQFTTQPNYGELTGKVLDQLSAPIQGALVSLENGQTAATDRDGVFSITAPSGTHTLTISYEGYGDITMNVTLAVGETTDIGSTSMSKEGNDYSWVIILTFVLLVAVAIELIYLQKKRKK
ncbi:MAG: carboxypeptidase regulatory-like domain-containing protein, partial [Methanomassiliicoccales archaeon]|nr:carboxypeptidase regulatory-like domain-containing protein [Methanomassiliicoccales archaeon]